VASVALADCGAQGTYETHTVGIPAVGGVVAGAPCASDYGLTEGQVISASWPPCNSSVEKQGGGYFIRFCGEGDFESAFGTPPKVGQGWTGYAPIGGDQ
jgi:hypothetical protein